MSNQAGQQDAGQVAIMRARRAIHDAKGIRSLSTVQDIQEEIQAMRGFLSMAQKHLDQFQQQEG